MSVDNYDESLVEVHWALKQTIKQFFLGWLLLCCSLLLMMQMGGMLSVLLLPVFFFSLVVMGWPFIKAVLKGGNFSEALNPKYEVIRTYSDGSKKSDHGKEDANQRGLFGIILIFLLAIPGVIVQAVRLVIQIIKYFIYFGKASNKPNFFRSGFLTMLLGVIGLVAAPVIGIAASAGYTILSNKDGAQDSLKMFLSAKYVKVTQDGVSIYASPSDNAQIVETAEKDQLLTYSAEAQDGWLAIKYRAEGYPTGADGWIKEQYVQKTRVNPFSEMSISVNDKRENNSFKKGNTVVVTTDTVIFNKADLESGFLDEVIKEGTELTVTGKIRNDFVPIEFEGKSGWVDVADVKSK